MNEKSFFLPAEWAHQWGVQLTWPHVDTDWHCYLDAITETYVEMARAISERESLLVVAPHIIEVKQLLLSELTAEQFNKVLFFECPTNDTWSRDHGFISLMGKDGLQLCDFRFNGWGEKFAAEKDNAVNGLLFSFLSEQFGLSDVSVTYRNDLDFVLEGGSIESDGKGTVFTTKCCLLAPHRNEPLSQFEIENELKRRLGAERIVWIDTSPLEGDDTDGHIDTIVRICPDDTLLFVDDDHLEQQLSQLRTLSGRPYRLIRLPQPDAIYEDGERLPATYANFLVVNDAVLMPIYGQLEKDMEAIRLVACAFPGRDIIPIDSRVIIRQHGSIHCCTMQFPSLII